MSKKKKRLKINEIDRLKVDMHTPYVIYSESKNMYWGVIRGDFTYFIQNAGLFSEEFIKIIYTYENLWLGDLRIMNVFEVDNHILIRPQRDINL